jgi:FkbM family methyltransferase
MVMTLEGQALVRFRRRIRDLLEVHPSIYGIAIRLYRVWRKPAPTLQQRMLKALPDNDEVFFIQVGSNDGLHGDPLHDLLKTHASWRGIFIEPVKFLFQRLKQNYAADPRFIYENVAIDREERSRPFFYVSPKAQTELGEELPYWHDQLGSFDREHILRGLGKKLEPYIVEEAVECVPLKKVLDRNGVKRIDLVHIDTEGHDYQILSQIDLQKYKPTIILFEHNLLSPSEAAQARNDLESADYELFEYGADTLAVKR